MKLNQMTLAVAVAMAISLGSVAKAEADENDGITASPKVRQMLNERKAARAQPVIAYGKVQSVAPILASPKAQQALSERVLMVKGAATEAAVVAGAGYKAIGADGITASPRTRQELDQRAAAPVMVAPVK